MRIVDVCAFYSPFGGGVRTYIDAKFRSAAALGHELVVVIPAATASVVELGPGLLLAGIPSPRMPFDRRYRYFNDRSRLFNELSRWRPDHVECSSPWSSASAVASWGGSASRALFMHSDPMAAYAYRWFGYLRPSLVDRLFSRFWDHIRSLGRGFDLVVSPSRQLSDRLTQRGLANVCTVPLGVEERFSPAHRDPVLRKELLGRLGLGPSGKLLLAVGRLAPEKRPELIVNAVIDAAKQHNVGLVFAGDGSLRARLQRLAGATSRVRLLSHIGDRDQLARLIASADALVHGCEAETFGLVIGEALASGTPVIVPDRGGAFEQLKPGRGLSYAAGSRADLARKIGLLAQSEPSGGGAGELRPRLMDDHFRDLFDCYGRLSKGSASACGQRMNAM